MGIFGGEKYSKDAYMGAIKDAQEKTGMRTRDDGTEFWTVSQEVLDLLTRKAARARQKVEELHGKGQAEAIGLNEEYERLLARAQEAMKAVEDFEKEKLGMTEGE